jgi:membrane-associated protease RseP (regulator of RpoE activity)
MRLMRRKLSSGQAMAIAGLMLCLLTLVPAWAQSDAASIGPALKSITPQIDPNADKKPEKPAKSKPLQASIQHNESMSQSKRKPALNGNASGGGFMGKLRGGGRTGDADSLAGKANNNGFNSQITSGCGIIGVKFIIAQGHPPIVNRVFIGTPAAQVGMVPNDAIVAVDGVPTLGLTKEEVYDLIIGSPGTSVNISLMHGSDVRVVNCTRMDINDITDPLVRRDYLMSM